MRYKRPDRKNALSILEASKRDMEFTLTLPVSDASGTTIIRNIYECFRMLGDALLVARGIESEDHVAPVKELMDLGVRTERPIRLVDNLRRMRHNINYYGYKPNVPEVKDAVSFASLVFEPLYSEVLRIVNE